MEPTSTCIGTLNVGETNQTTNKGVVGEKMLSSYMLISKNQGLPFKELNLKATSLKPNFALL